MKFKNLSVVTAYLYGFLEEVYVETPELLAESLQQLILRENTDKTMMIKTQKMLKQLVEGKKVCHLRKVLCGLRQLDVSGIVD